MNTAQDVFGWAVGILVATAAVAGLLVYASAPLGLLAVLAVPAFIGQCLLLVSLIAWGVRLGQNAARQDAHR